MGKIEKEQTNFQNGNCWKQNIVFLFIFTISILFISCATIIKGPDQKIDIKTNPDTAAIFIYNYQGFLVTNGISPFTAILPRGQGYFQSAEYKIHIQKEGFTDNELLLRGTLDVPAYILGNVFFNWIGWSIDPISGAIWNLEPKSIYANMASNGSTVAVNTVNYSEWALAKDLVSQYHFFDDGGADKLKKYSLTWNNDQKNEFYKMNEKSGFWSLLDLLPLYGLGSWLVGDTAGGTVCAVGDFVGTIIAVLPMSFMGVRLTPTEENILIGMTIGGMATVASCDLYGVISGFYYANSYNYNLRSGLGISDNIPNSASRNKIASTHYHINLITYYF